MRFTEKKRSKTLNCTLHIIQLPTEEIRQNQMHDSTITLLKTKSNQTIRPVNCTSKQTKAYISHYCQSSACPEARWLHQYWHASCKRRHCASEKIYDIHQIDCILMWYNVILLYIAVQTAQNIYVIYRKTGLQLITKSNSTRIRIGENEAVFHLSTKAMQTKKCLALKHHAQLLRSIHWQNMESYGLRSSPSQRTDRIK